MKTLNEILTVFLAADFEIALSKPQLALLLLIHHRLYASESQNQDIHESELANFFHSIDKLEANDSAGAQARGRAAISALQKSGVIIRSDCGGLSAIEPIYSLTSLGRAIAENITRHVQFDKDTLRSILSEAMVRLSEIASKLSECITRDDWQRRVTIPLREFVQGAFERILRYQSNLDVRHEAVREEIFTLVQAKADQAIEPCVQLLEQSMHTITELRDILLESLIKTDDIVLDISVQARNAEQREAMAAADGILRRTAQISDWTQTRVDAWSLHYQNVHSFLRYVVRVDPQRQIAERVKDAIRNFTNDKPCLNVCREPNIQHLNESFLELPPERPTRLREDFAMQTVNEESHLVAQLAKTISNQVADRLCTNGSVRLSEILHNLDEVSWHDLHLAIGVAMQQVLKDHDAVLDREYDWTAVRGTAEIQDIQIHK